MVRDSLLADNALIRMLFAEKRSDDLTSHLLDMAVVATRMGIVLHYDQDSQRDLALCALLHDIGMLRVSPEVVKKQGKLSSSDLAEIRKHPLYSYEILQESGLPAVVAEVARQVHEKEDGSGYPRGLRGDEIHEYATIISLADTFTAMLQPRPQRERKMPFEIVKEIIERGQGHFNRRLMKVLIDEFAIFPVGLYVQLNTGEMARVKKANRLAPLRPEVTVVTDARGRGLAEPREYNLMREPLLAVVDSAFELKSGFTGKPAQESGGGSV
jgi:HD-GYP domain-containing protein (c-di-GMP phosphodiesterase class II)